MKIIVVGCGKIGTTIVSSLVAEGHDVVAIDSSPSVIEDITNIYDAIGVCGNGADYETLAEAGIENSELFVSVTGSDELNMLSCYIAKCMGAKHTIARIRNPEYNDSSLSFMRQKLDLSMSINPELLTALELFNVLKLPAAAKVETFARRHFEMIEFVIKPDSKMDGLNLIELRKKYPQKFLICVVKRDENVYIPDGNFVLKSGDKIGIVATPAELHKLLKNLGSLKKQARNVMILGGSTTAFYLAKLLLQGGNEVKIIEKNPERCLDLAEKLPSAVIINGDGAQQELLLEEGLTSMDAFVALTGMDEQNILLSYFANSHDIPKVITKINRDEFKKMAYRLGLDSIVSPKKTISDVVLRYARALNNSLGSSVETLYTLMDSEAEALEFIVSGNSPVLNIPLKDLNLKPNTIIAGIVRNRKNILPSGDDVILRGDSVIVITTGQRFDDISEIIG